MLSQNICQLARIIESETFICFWCSKSKELILRSTFVSGDLSVLAQLDLKLLDLSGTWVSGQLEDLISDGKPNLRQLKLTGTQLTGQLSALTMLNQLQEVDLAHTSITGQITNAWAGKLQDLTRLQLRQSLVQFVPDEEDFWSFVASHKTQSWESLLGSLQELDLTNCILAFARCIASRFLGNLPMSLFVLVFVLHSSPSAQLTQLYQLLFINCALSISTSV